MRTRRTFLKTTIGLAGGMAASSGGALWRPSPAGAVRRQSEPSGTPKPGGTLRIVLSGPVTTFDTAHIDYYEERKAIRLIYDPLIALGDDGQPNAARSLAEKWEFADPRTFILHLRKGVKFQDGTPLDAAAVKFNLERHLDPAIASSARSELTPVASVDAVDALTVKINLKSPVAVFPLTLFDRSGYQISPTAWQKYGKENYGAHPAGTGAFKLVELVPGDHCTFERNPDYWASPMPYVDHVEIRTIPNDSTRLIELQSGGADIAEPLPYQDIARIKQTPSIVLQSQLLRMEILRWNVDSQYGKSQELRQAFDWALDREAIKRTVYFDTGVVGYAPFFPGTPYYDPTYKPFTHDVDKAKALLDKAGLPSPIQFTYYIGEDPVDERAAAIFQANFHDIGVTINIQKEQQAAADARQDKGDYNLTPTWWGWRPDPYFYMPIFESSGANFTYFQPGQWKNPTFDKLVDAAASEQDLEKRKADYSQAVDLLNGGGAWVFYRFGPVFIGSSPKVHGFTDPKSTIADYAKVWLE